MSDNYRLSGQGPDATFVNHLYKEGLAIASGDFLWIDSTDVNKVKPFSSYTWDTNIATTMGTLNAVFVGVAGEARFASGTVAQTGAVVDSGEITCACAALGADVPPGTLVTGVKQASANLVDNRLVATTSTLGASIGRTSRWSYAGDTSLTFRMATLTNAIGFNPT